ncbi:Clp protease ClpP [Pseudomaricurvus alkylphenolicus]|uniref:ClpP-like prohead protease/major capsid protein fusion protein n=1 Tax=Pseudomaricurvus alkylphenolicus TaxID=1306991 RepID=UPI0014244353|nr:ClpP-like prohead protease/major capsid protein fusion protein [Pseudomaricurvus alkylphenolicus]NIB44820.1 Clp protease ClpP [Pseudomaricurvus alkylphenolicus]
MKLNNLSRVVAMASGVVTGTRCAINGKGELLIYGVIGDWWDDLDAETVVRQAEVAVTDGDLVVRIHSPGGNLMEGLAIYNALKRSEKRVVVYIDGIAASMGSAVACAGDVVRMPSNALWMMHKPSLAASGNADELREMADQIDILEGSYVDCYAQKGNQTAEQITALISDGKDHWLTPQQCLEMGLCDEIVEDVAIAASYQPASFHNPPSDLWNGLASTAAAAAKPTRKTSMKFKVVAKSGGNTAMAASILQLLAAAFSSVDDALAKLKGIDNAKALITGEVEASDEQLGELEAALKPSEPASQPVPAVTTTTTAVADSVAAASQAVAQERKRIADITEMGAKYGLETAVVTAYINDGISLSTARDRALDVVAQRSQSQMPAPGVRVTSIGTEAANVAMAQALLHRFDPVAYKIDDNSKMFAHMTLIELATAHLNLNGIDTAGMSKSAIAAKAMHSSSDFAAILADVANKTLRAGYEAAPRTFTRFCRRVTASDFKAINRAQLDSAGASLNKVNEKGEFRRGKLTDGKESYGLATYGEILAITRQTLINDDLDALSRIPMMQGAQVAETESEVVWDLILSDVTMGDGKALFHNDHKNTGTGVIAEAGLNTMRKKMRTQKKLDDKTPINLAPAFLMVPAALETTAQKFLASITPDQPSSVNPFAGTMELLVEARLDGDSEVKWYGAASSNRIDTIEYAYLEGQEGAYLETRQGFDVDGVEMKVRLDFGAGVIDYRGLYRSTGA